MGTTIFAEMSALAVATGSINLGQGFPDEDGPPEVFDAAVAAIREHHNQYPPELKAEVDHALRKTYAGSSIMLAVCDRVRRGAAPAFATRRFARPGSACRNQTQGLCDV